MLCYFYYISPLLFQKWGMVKAGNFYFEPEFECCRQSSSGSLPVHITSTIRLSPFLCDDSDMKAPTTIRHFASLIYPFSSLTLKGVRTHGIMESWRIWHCYLQENEHIIGWVVKQHQMVDLNKNFIRSLFCHFLVLLLILSMFNHFLLKYERFLIY